MKINTDSQKIEKILTHGVKEIIVKNHLEKQLKSGRNLRVKFGIDPTAPDIHLGHSVPLRKLKQFQELGHQIILIIGDFTAQIGDPSERKETRKPLTAEEIKKNMKGYLKQADKIINLDKTEVIYNSEWFAKDNAKIIFKLARAGSIQQILHRTDFQKRLQKNQDITLLETLYPLLQGYDSVMVKADVEIGGTDQLFNLLMGRKVQRFYEMPEQDILTTSLLEGLDGIKKMSKSAGNYIAVNETPNKMFEKIMRLPDNLIAKYFLLCTDKSKKEIQKIKTDMERSKLNPRDVKARLAHEIVALYHGKIAAQKAEKEFNQIFKEKKLPSEIPLIKIAAKNINILDLLTKTKLASSKAEAKRLIEQKGVKINNEIQEDWRKNIPIKNGMIIQSGKRRFAKIIQ
ncbi:MAG: tyrosine--tRNA ligase [bacterium]|nr:tyrosine--tRNA ligase [bacterium]